MARTGMVNGGITRGQCRTADTAEQAMVWMRTSVRTLLSAFSPEEQARAYGWLDHGQWEAVARLKAAEPYAFGAAVGDTYVEWSARLVGFLPVVQAADGASDCRGTPR
ncbi:hypothetical protein ABZ921_33555 [Streptomyces atriruber]|uniref:Uncharacterized protein n=1 Tax=Streptomyces atriruber TaxID=545121 RepID=A0ABV3BX30_9ACTN